MTQVPDLKIKFGEIADIQKQIKGIFDALYVKIAKLKQFHSEFVLNSKSEIFVFGLDALNFQCKLIDMEFEDLRRIYLAINNHMYCEYFKLHKIIVAYVNEQAFDKKIMELAKGNKFPVYKDLEPFKEYDFATVNEVHDSILLILNAMYGYLEGKEHELQFHTVKKNIGLNIDNFISSFSFDLTIIREKINLFLNYLTYFHTLHTKQLTRFCSKIQSLYMHVNKDIRFDDAIQITKEDKPLNSSRSSIIIDDDSSSIADEDSVGISANDLKEPEHILPNIQMFKVEEPQAAKDEIQVLPTKSAEALLGELLGVAL